MRGGFSYVEVLISIVILSFFGVVLLNFNAFNKRAMEHNIRLQKNLLINTPIIYIQDINKRFGSQAEEVNLYDFTHFSKLESQDKKFLKNAKLKIQTKEEGKLFLFSDAKGVKNYMLYGNVGVAYGENLQKYLWVKQTK